MKIWEQILAFANARKSAERHAHTVRRNMDNGRCGLCRKKPFDCRCPNGPTLKANADPGEIAQAA